jgi:hypothetical protein
MDIGDLHDFILFLENKAQTNWHTPQEIDNAIHRSSMDLFWAFAPVYGEDEVAKAALDPFVQVYQVTPVNSPNGVITLPQGLGSTSPLNFARLLSALAVSYDNALKQVILNDIDMVNNDEVSKRTKSQLKPLSPDWPAATSKGNGVFQLYPQIPNTATFTYLALPVKPVYGYTRTGSQGRVLQYSPGTSTQLQWNESYFSKIIDGAVVYLGLNLGDTNLVQFMSQKAAS